MSDVKPATELLRGYIEPAAVDLRPDHDGQIKLSIAISLKRQADMMEKDLEPVIELARDPEKEPTLIERQRAELIELDRRCAAAMERMANMVEIIGAGWGNADPFFDFQGMPFGRQAPPIPQRVDDE